MYLLSVCDLASSLLRNSDTLLLLWALSFSVATQRQLFLFGVKLGRQLWHTNLAVTAADLQRPNVMLLAPQDLRMFPKDPPMSVAHALHGVTTSF